MCSAAKPARPFNWPADQVADLLGASPREIIFTSGATESNNLAIRGVAGMYRSRGDHIITVATEHHAVLDPCLRLGREGFRVTVLPVGSDGIVDPQRISDAIDERTILVSGHGGQQRNRHSGPSGGNRPALQTQGDPVSQRRGAGLRQDVIRC